jgi:hypothetical protein
MRYLRGKRATKVQQSKKSDPTERRKCSGKIRPIIQDKKEGAGPRESLNAKNTNAALFVWIARGNDISQSSRFVTEDVHREWHDRE